MPGRRFRLLCIAGLLSVMLGARVTPAATPDAYDPWPGLVQDIFANRPMNDGAGVVAIEMPYRAEDAAIVPVTLRNLLSPDDSRRVLRITLVIDQNPAPMAATFELGPDAKVSEISTRVRVNNYTDVHAVAELSDGKLYLVTKTYVKASGEAARRQRPLRTADEARSRLGQMRYRQFTRAGQGPASGAREAQIMIGHPSNSGLQMDQVTQLLYSSTAASMVRLWQGRQSGARQWKAASPDFGKIQISECTYVFQRRETFSGQRPRTSNGHTFQQEWKTDNPGT